MAYAHYGAPDYKNAFCNPLFMGFGDGMPFSASLDIVAHEFTHGVTFQTANLIYRDQMGALNESLSDIFGEMVERHSTGTTDWMMGSHLGAPAEMRNLADPASIVIPNSGGIAYPSKMSEFLVVDVDNGGVHLNCLIVAHAFYLLAEGLPNAVGADTAARIFHQAQTGGYLTSNSDFVAARLECLQVARDLYGADAPEVTAVGDAFDAVEIYDPTGGGGGGGTLPDLPTIPVVNAPDSTLYIFPWQGVLYLVRQEPDIGPDEYLYWPVAPTRPSVSGNGAVAVMVTANHDAAVVLTDGSDAPQPFGMPGQISAVTLAPDGGHAAFVFRDQAGNPRNEIVVVDYVNETQQSYTLAVATADGAEMPIGYADAMDFTADGRILIYDAYSEVSLPDGTVVGNWGIYSLDLERGITSPLILPEQGTGIARRQSGPREYD